MKILALADIHGSWNVLYMIEEFEALYDFDAVFIAGDITNFGPPDFAYEFLNSINKPVFAVPGNCDPPEVIDAIENSRAVNVHQKKYNYRGNIIAGLGGTDGNGFTMGITFDDNFAYKFLNGCKECILLLHQPPYGILDKVGNIHIGNKAIRKAVEKFKPRLVISGHVHEARGYFKNEYTIFVNPGPAKLGYASLVDLTAESVEMLEK